ncbi:hypothetical protein N0V91_010240 [Didymella pomorum]|uniref:Uncharacterized protein n=1 Tax=Didymella pomorum TaxID=749634 RepID=A0A9W8Z7M1_9PLEO|nr:hypothetical protein N0V91_010240 [Didymella pomorum]
MDSSRTLSPAPLDADTPTEDLLAHAEDNAVLALLSLRHTAKRPMTREDMHTDIVSHRHSTLSVHQGVSGHWDTYGTWVKESEDEKDLRWEKRDEKWVKESEGGKHLKWVKKGEEFMEESQERSSLRREREYGEEVEMDGKRKKIMAAMLLAYADQEAAMERFGSGSLRAEAQRRSHSSVHGNHLNDPNFLGSPYCPIVPERVAIILHLDQGGLRTVVRDIHFIIRDDQCMIRSITTSVLVRK